MKIQEKAQEEKGERKEERKTEKKVIMEMVLYVCYRVMVGVHNSVLQVHNCIIIA